jgi:hypothetical protein
LAAEGRGCSVASTGPKASRTKRAPSARPSARCCCAPGRSEGPAAREQSC